MSKLYEHDIERDNMFGKEGRVCQDWIVTLERRAFSRSSRVIARRFACP